MDKPPRPLRTLIWRAVWVVLSTVVLLLLGLSHSDRGEGAKRWPVKLHGVPTWLRTSAPTRVTEGAKPLRVEADRARLERELERLHKEIAPWEKKLANIRFVERAKPEVVDKARRIHKELSEKVDRIRTSLGAGAS